MNNIYKRLDQIIPKMKETKFLEGTGLGNEINFRIFDYYSKDELIVREKIKSIKKEFDVPNSQIKIIEFDLYKMLIEMAKEEEIFDDLFEFENNEGKKEFKLAIIDFAKPEYFIEKIKEKAEDYNTIFITGIGKVFPFVRSHSILNNLHEVIEKKPVVLFFPGVYDLQSLKLFGKIKDDNYYRAFPLVDKGVED